MEDDEGCGGRELVVGMAANKRRCPIMVTVKSPYFFPSQELRVSCLVTDTVAELKEEIRNKWRVYVRDVITLHRGGRPPAGQTMEDDCAALSAYLVADGDVIVADFARAVVGENSG